MTYSSQSVRNSKQWMTSRWIPQAQVWDVSIDVFIFFPLWKIVPIMNPSWPQPLCSVKEETANFFQPPFKSERGNSKDRFWVEYYLNIPHKHKHKDIHSSEINALFRCLFFWNDKFLHISQCKHCISSIMQEGFNVCRTWFSSRPSPLGNAILWS